MGRGRGREGGKATYLNRDNSLQLIVVVIDYRKMSNIMVVYSRHSSDDTVTTFAFKNFGFCGHDIFDSNIAINRAVGNLIGRNTRNRREKGIERENER